MRDVALLLVVRTLPKDGFELIIITCAHLKQTFQNVV